MIKSCGNCQHFFFFFYCEAFPEGIPFEILHGGMPHLKILKDEKFHWELLTEENFKGI